MPSDPTLLGTVQDVAGATVSVALGTDTVSGLAFIRGHGYRIGQIGSFVRIPLGYTDLFGVVSHVGAGAVPERLVEVEPHGYRWLRVELVGEGDSQGAFRRGVSQYPTIGDSVHLVVEDDLARIYGRPDAPDYVRVGHLASAESIPALVNIDRLVTRHSAVVGATGSGKSTTVAGLIAAVTAPESYPSARVIILDIHGEYAAALRDRAAVFRVNPDVARDELPLCIPYWAMTFDELAAVCFGPLEDPGRGAVIERITALKLESLRQTPREGVTEDILTVDSPVPFSIHRLWFDLHCEIRATFYAQKGAQQSLDTWALDLDGDGKTVRPGDVMRAIPPLFRRPKDVQGDPEKIRLSTSPLNVGRQVDRLGSRLRDNRFDFLFRPGPWLPNQDGVPVQDLDTLLERWLGATPSVAILDLSGVPVSVVTDLVGVVLRVIYDALFWARALSEGGRERPLLLVLEEAHAYLGREGDGAAASAVRRIVREGRKYGIGAMIISQRPSEIDATVLSQCGTLVSMRMNNQSDRAHVSAAVTDNLQGLLAMLPVLRTGEAIISGEAVQLPVRTLLEPPPKNRRPESEDPLVYDDKGPGGWNRRREPSDYADVVATWRSQNPRSRRAR